MSKWLKKYLWVFPVIALLPIIALAGSPSSPGVGPLNVSITGGNAGGDLGGTYPNPTVLQFNGTPLGTMATQNASAVAITGGTMAGAAVNTTTIGATTPSTGAFTTLSASNTVTLSPASHNVTISSTGTGTVTVSPVGALTVNPTAASTMDNVALGASTPLAVHATTLSASSTVSGNGFSTYLASPPAIGGTAPAAGAFTTLSASSTVSGTGFSTYLASPPAIGGTAPAAGKFTSVTNTAGTISGGTTFTIASGCGTGGTAPSSLTGGAETGSFVSNVTSCSPVINLPTAPNGWWCSAVDLTHTGDAFVQTATSTSSCTLSATVTLLDVVIFHAEAY